MLMLLLTIVCSYASHTDSYSKRASAELVLADRVGDHIFKCPMKHFVVGFTLKKEKVRCRKFREPAKKRDKKNCQWLRECYDSDKSNQKDFRIARGLRFVLKKRRNNKVKAKTQIQLYCCKENCKSFDCDDKLFSKPIVGAESKKVEFVNKVIHEKGKKTMKAEFCRPKCPAIGGGDPGALGDELGGILGGITKLPCLDLYGKCVNHNQCCGDLICQGFTKFCAECYPKNFPCDNDGECCSKKCNKPIDSMDPYDGVCK